MGFLGALIGGGTSLLGGILGSSAASKAAQQQQQAALNASNFAKNNQNQALGDIGQNLNSQLGALAPYEQAGKSALGNLSDLLGTPGQGLLQNWDQSFQAPTAAQAAATPGYQFAVQQGNKALQASAAARGGLLSGGTAKALDQYNQGLADTNYQQVYNNAFQNYQQNYNQFQQGQANQYNRLMGQAGLGEWGTGAAVNALGQASGQQVGTLLDTSRTVGQDLTNAGAAAASGTVGSANAWNGALSGIGNAAGNYALLSQLNGQYGPATQSGYNIGGPGTPQWNPSYMPPTGGGQSGYQLPTGVPPTAPLYQQPIG